VEARVSADTVEVRHRDQVVPTMPRSRKEDEHRIDDPMSSDGRDMIVATYQQVPAMTTDADGHATGPGSVPAWDDFRRQEATLILLNLLVLASVVVMHLAFWPLLLTPPLGVALALGVRFVEQAAEFAWLQRAQRPLAPPAVVAYSHASIWTNVGFAFLMGLLGRGHDSHYHVLMVLPMIAAGFRLSPRGLAAVVVAGSGLTLLQVWIHEGHRPDRWTEFFEAATMALIFLVVALVVRLLSRQLERDRTRLRRSLDDLQRTRDRLMAEEKLGAVGRLAAALAHEIRNPVTTMSSSIELARSQPGRLLESEALDVVLEEARRLERLTSDFLGYARPRQPEMLAVPTGALMGYVASSVRARAEAAGVKVSLADGEDFDRLLDPSQMQQALVNLALNAIEATPPGGLVRLGAERGDGTADLFFVENTAGPIDAALTGRLFEPFFTTRPHGTGLGLAIARNIARAHGGDVLLARNEPGLVRFEIRVPAGRPPAPAGMTPWRES
jgi:signal transduction histidine kinase